jgi:hypothetical protein
MVIDEAFFLAQPHDTQTSGHSSSAKRQDGSDQQDFGMLPDRLGEQGRKLYNQRQQLGRQCLQLKTSLGKSGLQLRLSAVVFSKIKNGQSRAKAVQVLGELLSSQIWSLVGCFIGAFDRP